jgi:hypothetical protein
MTNIGVKRMGRVYHRQNLQKERSKTSLIVIHGHSPILLSVAHKFQFKSCGKADQHIEISAVVGLTQTIFMFCNCGGREFPAVDCRRSQRMDSCLLVSKLRAKPPLTMGYFGATGHSEN